MKIYFAAVHTLKQVRDVGGGNLLFSYYDIEVSNIPFRKVSWKLLVKQAKKRMKNAKRVLLSKPR